ncbi:hypothetical protein COBT_003527, partial [Conglomerata obtusa]
MHLLALSLKLYIIKTSASIKMVTNEGIEINRSPQVIVQANILSDIINNSGPVTRIFYRLVYFGAKFVFSIVDKWQDRQIKNNNALIRAQIKTNGPRNDRVETHGTVVLDGQNNVKLRENAESIVEYKELADSINKIPSDYYEKLPKPFDTYVFNIMLKFENYINKKAQIIEGESYLLVQEEFKDLNSFNSKIVLPIKNAKIINSDESETST